MPEEGQAAGDMALNEMNTRMVVKIGGHWGRHEARLKGVLWTPLVMRYGEADQPGPREDEDCPPLDSDDEECAPPWAKGSVPFYQVDNKGRIHAELVPPHLVEITRQEKQMHRMSDNEFKDFLDEIEERSGLYRQRQKRAQDDWNDYEMFMKGIQVPGGLEVEEGELDADDGAHPIPVASAPRRQQQKRIEEPGAAFSSKHQRVEAKAKRAKAVSRWRNIPGAPAIEELEEDIGSGGEQRGLPTEVNMGVHITPERRHDEVRHGGARREGRSRGKGRKSKERSLIYLSTARDDPS